MIHVKYDINLYNKVWEIDPYEVLQSVIIEKNNKISIYEYFMKAFEVVELVGIQKYRTYTTNSQLEEKLSKLDFTKRISFKLYCANIIAAIEKYTDEQWLNDFSNYSTEKDLWNIIDVILDRVNILRSNCFRDYGHEKAPFRTLVWNHSLVINEKDLLDVNCLGINPLHSNIDRKKEKISAYSQLGKFCLLSKDWSSIQLHLCYPTQSNYDQAFTEDKNIAKSPSLFSDLIKFYEKMFDTNKTIKYIE